jgi:wyosine [tRNA(Phe)-imidazoG37] synthetase (radical SAM superfamily)
MAGADGEPLEIVYGPVSSWRLGRSLGIDPICAKGKICSFDCVYCSLGRTTIKTMERRTFVPAKIVRQDLEKALKKVNADVVTFSGTGEPTLAKNLGELIEIARDVSGIPVAVLTNSSLLFRKDVRRDLVKADIVKGKLDASNDELFKRINCPHEKISLSKIIKSLEKFRKEFAGSFALEIMFVPENKQFSEEIAKIVRIIKPDEIQINTPLRPSPVRPLTPTELREVQKSFKGTNFRTVYKAEKPRVGKVIGKKKIKELKRVDRQ